MTEASIEITETGPGAFALTVTVEGRRFECGSYLSRAAALEAGRMFLRRKEGEAAGQKKRPRRKGG